MGWRIESKCKQTKAIKIKVYFIDCNDAKSCSLAVRRVAVNRPEDAKWRARTAKANQVRLQFIISQVWGRLWLQTPILLKKNIQKSKAEDAGRSWTKQEEAEARFEKNEFQKEEGQTTSEMAVPDCLASSFAVHAWTVCLETGRRPVVQVSKVPKAPDATRERELKSRDKWSRGQHWVSRNVHNNLRGICFSGKVVALSLFVAFLVSFEYAAKKDSTQLLLNF